VNSSSPRIRVLVVEADIHVRQGLTRILGQHPSIEVVAAAINGRTAVPKIATYKPDCVVLGVDPGVDGGAELLVHLQHAHADTKRVVLAKAGGADVVHKLTLLGANEVVVRGDTVGEAGLERLSQELVAPIVRLGRSARAVAPLPPHAADKAPVPVASASIHAHAAAPHSPSLPAYARSGGRIQVVGIGVSTGGPRALSELLPRLPADFPVPIVLVQHMPPQFTKSLAESLDRVCKVRVREAKDGDRLERGVALIAPGGLHLKVVRGDACDIVKLTEDPPECACRPSVDYLFRSLTETFGRSVLGVVLTGMGEDGWIGARAIHAAGGRVLAQDQVSSTVWGMPRGPIEAGIAPAVGLDHMAEAIALAMRAVPCS
jgi:two-component system, chemotaxis family, protein-glutamate methylesterase/glutaminase